ncbi:MAG: heme A synthase [Anaerolineae bacterium]|nr:heme A synthase [Anaerolineae bacterium]
MAGRPFARYAWLVTGFTVLVILWGAVVRATGSGAGCGNHWPTCNGQIIPQPEQIETLIEFIHRLTSGLSGLLVLALAVWAFRAGWATRFTRRAAALALLFMMVEALVGMLLVRLELVADNASTTRAVVIALHLVNTLALLASLALTAWSASGQRISLQGKPRRLAGLLGLALAGMVLLSAAGAVTALGDTLFPPESLIAGLQQDLDATAHFLIRLRVIHPAIALLVSAFLLVAGQEFLAASATARRPVIAMYALVILQIAAGFVNVILLAPVWMQVLHLLLADSLWLALVLVAAEALAAEGASPAAHPA